MGDAEDFWPAIEEAEDPNSPVVLLRKQAENLSAKSGRRLLGRVSTTAGTVDMNARLLLGLGPFENVFTHRFTIEVPALEDYSYALFAITHGIETYPVTYEDERGQWQALDDVNAFTAWLKQTLSSDKTKRILKTLSEQAGQSPGRW
jgi:hypothetical protein